MERVFVDTSAWVAHLNRGDPAHRRVRAALADLTGPLVTSNFVLDESVTLCRRRHGHAAATTLGSALFGGDVAHVVRITAEDELQAWELFAERADHVYSFTDCTSFVLMRRLAIRTAAALDDDFRREGFAVVPD